MVMDLLMKPRPSYMPKYVPKAGDGCVLYLEGQQDPYSSTIRDLSGYGNHGTLVGTTWVRNAQGVVVNSFDGVDDKITGSISVTPPYTLIFWASETRVGSSFFDGQSADSANFFVYNAPRDLYFNNGSQIGPLTNTPLLTWQMYTAVVNGASSSIRLNNGTPVTGTLAATALTSYIIGISLNPSYKLNGRQWGVRLVNIALSTTQIAGIYNQERHLFGV